MLPSRAARMLRALAAHSQGKVSLCSAITHLIHKVLTQCTAWRRARDTASRLSKASCRWAFKPRKQRHPLKPVAQQTTNAAPVQDEPSTASAPSEETAADPALAPTSGSAPSTTDVQTVLALADTSPPSLHEPSLVDASLSPLYSSDEWVDPRPSSTVAAVGEKESITRRATATYSPPCTPSEVKAMEKETRSRHDSVVASTAPSEDMPISWHDRPHQEDTIGARIDHIKALTTLREQICTVGSSYLNARKELDLIRPIWSAATTLIMDAASNGTELKTWNLAQAYKLKSDMEYYISRYRMWEEYVLQLPRGDACPMDSKFWRDFELGLEDTANVDLEALGEEVELFQDCLLIITKGQNRVSVTSPTWEVAALADPDFEAEFRALQSQQASAPVSLPQKPKALGGPVRSLRGLDGFYPAPAPSPPPSIPLPPDPPANEGPSFHRKRHTQRRTPIFQEWRVDRPISSTTTEIQSQNRVRLGRQYSHSSGSKAQQPQEPRSQADAAIPEERLTYSDRRRHNRRSASGIPQPSGSSERRYLVQTTAASSTPSMRRSQRGSVGQKLCLASGIGKATTQSARSSLGSTFQPQPAARPSQVPAPQPQPVSSVGTRNQPQTTGMQIPRQVFNSSSAPRPASTSSFLPRHCNRNSRSLPNRTSFVADVQTQHDPELQAESLTPSGDAPVQVELHSFVSDSSVTAATTALSSELTAETHRQPREEVDGEAFMEAASDVPVDAAVSEFSYDAEYYAIKREGKKQAQ